MKTYRVKPRHVIAVKLEDSEQSILDALEFIGFNIKLSDAVESINRVREEGGLVIRTKNSGLTVSFGDYIVKEITGEIYKLNPHSFHDTYELCE